MLIQKNISPDKIMNDKNEKILNVLCLDGGGSLGVYTLGVLEALRDVLGKELHEVFDLIYGTSTGSIIGSMIALDTPIDEISREYFELAPYIMTPWLASEKSKRLREKAEIIFKDKKFNEFNKIVGIVTVDRKKNRQRIFKSNPDQNFNTELNRFNPGFGATIADAVIGSCAAFPIFKKHLAHLEGGDYPLIDGGFVANDPSLFALTDAVYSLNYSEENITMLSVGVGIYRPNRLSWLQRIVDPLELMEIVFETSRNGYTEALIPLIFKKVQRFRINSDYTENKTIRTSFIESKIETLKHINKLGKDSFEKYSYKDDLINRLLKNVN